MRNGLALINGIGQDIDGRKSTLVELRVANIEFNTLFRQSIERALDRRHVHGYLPAEAGADRAA